MVSVYQFAINNIKAHLRSEENQKLVNRLDPAAMNAFAAAPVLAVAFMKSQEEVLNDLIAN